MSATNGICRSAQKAAPPRLRTRMPWGRACVRDPREMDVFARLLDPRRGQEDLRTMFAGHAHRRPAAVQLGKITDHARHAQGQDLLQVLQLATENVPDGSGTATSRRLVNRRPATGRLANRRLANGRRGPLQQSRWRKLHGSSIQPPHHLVPQLAPARSREPSAAPRSARQFAQLVAACRPSRPNCSRSTSAVSGCRGPLAAARPIPVGTCSRRRCRRNTQRPPTAASTSRSTGTRAAAAGPRRTSCAAPAELRIVGLPDSLGPAGARPCEAVAGEGKFDLARRRPAPRATGRPGRLRKCGRPAGHAEVAGEGNAVAALDGGGQFDADAPADRPAHPAHAQAAIGRAGRPGPGLGCRPVEPAVRKARENGQFQFGHCRQGERAATVGRPGRVDGRPIMAASRRPRTPADLSRPSIFSASTPAAINSGKRSQAARSCGLSRYLRARAQVQRRLAVAEQFVGQPAGLGALAAIAAAAAHGQAGQALARIADAQRPVDEHFQADAGRCRIWRMSASDSSRASTTRRMPSAAATRMPSALVSDICVEAWMGQSGQMARISRAHAQVLHEHGVDAGGDRRADGRSSRLQLARERPAC